MKVTKLISVFFSIIGIGMLIGAFFITQSTLDFKSKAQLIEGQVLKNVQRRSKDSYTYYPIVAFITPDGRQVEFMSSTGSKPPSYAAGETVEVLYLPDNTEDARINSFFSLWFGSIVLGIMGSVFFLIGAGLAILGIRNKRRNAQLKTMGTPVDAQFCRVELNESYSSNGSHPYRITCQWQNPASGKIHVFHSDNLWFDPSDYINRENLTVFIDRNNPQNYVVDISFLPEIAD